MFGDSILDQGPTFPSQFREDERLLLVADSIQRLIKGNFDNLVGDVVTLTLLAVIALCSWQATFFALRWLQKRRVTSVTSVRRNISAVIRSVPSSSHNLSAVARNRSNTASNDGSNSNAENAQPAVDYRATGDGWENDGLNMDVDYETNSEILLLMINGVEDVSGEFGYDDYYTEEDEEADELQHLLQEVEDTIPTGETLEHHNTGGPLSFTASGVQVRVATASNSNPGAVTITSTPEEEEAPNPPD